MSAEPTALAASEAAQSFVRAELARAVQETGVSLAALGVACGKRSPTIAEGWQSGAKHLPVYVLANAAVPRAVRARLIAALVQRLEASAPRVGIDAATATLLVRAGELVTEIATALLDRQLSEDERGRIRAAAHRLLEALSRWIREDGAA